MHIWNTCLAFHLQFSFVFFIIRVAVYYNLLFCLNILIHHVPYGCQTTRIHQLRVDTNRFCTANLDISHRRIQGPRLMVALLAGSYHKLVRSTINIT